MGRQVGQTSSHLQHSKGNNEGRHAQLDADQSVQYASQRRDSEADHNAREIFSIVDRSYLIRDGKVLLSGTVDELLQSQEARAVYFGEDFKL